MMRSMITNFDGILFVSCLTLCQLVCAQSEIVTVTDRRPVAAAVRGQAQRITITISAPQTEVEIGAPVLLHIVLANLSRQDIYVYKAPGAGNAEIYYSISVFDIEGNARPTTTYGNAILNGGGRIGSRIGVMLKPGEKLEQDATISNLYDMKSVGVYRVIVKRPNPLDPTITLKSNEISITVTN